MAVAQGTGPGAMSEDAEHRSAHRPFWTTQESSVLTPRQSLDGIKDQERPCRTPGDRSQGQRSGTGVHGAHTLERRAAKERAPEAKDSAARASLNSWIQQAQGSEGGW